MIAIFRSFCLQNKPEKVHTQKGYMASQKSLSGKLASTSLFKNEASESNLVVRDKVAVESNLVERNKVAVEVKRVEAMRARQMIIP